MHMPSISTTTIGSPDDATRTLELALFRCDLYGIIEQLRAGANLKLECMAHEMRNGEWLVGLTAVSWAVALDSEADGLFLTPLVLHYGGDITQVDSEGRTLLSFARGRSVVRYLIEHGVPLIGGTTARKILLELVTCATPKTTEEYEKALSSLSSIARAEVLQVLGRAGTIGGTSALLPKSIWRKVLDPDYLAVLKHLGYHEQADILGMEAKVPATLPPLLATFHPAEVIGWALEAKDAERVRRLVKLGGANGDHRFSRSLEVEDAFLEFQGLTATGLALLIDCENERLSTGGGPWMRQTIGPPVFTALLMGAHSLHGAHDTNGNTLLHLAVTPGVCGWLLEKGLPVDVRNKAGELPIDVVPECVRVVIQRHLPPP